MNKHGKLNQLKGFRKIGTYFHFEPKEWVMGLRREFLRSSILVVSLSLPCCSLFSLIPHAEYIVNTLSTIRRSLCRVSDISHLVPRGLRFKAAVRLVRPYSFPRSRTLRCSSMSVLKSMPNIAIIHNGLFFAISSDVIPQFSVQPVLCIFHFYLPLLNSRNWANKPGF